MIPKIVVCIPTYNGAAYLPECIDSVLAQTFGDFEIMVVDDKSSDRTLEIAREYACRDSRIEVVENSSNLGLVGNWNRCVELAQGEWIKFVFQDDILDSRCLEKLIGSASAGDLIVACERTYLFENVAPEVEAEYGEYQKRLNLNALFGGKRRLSPDDIASAAIAHPGLNFIGEPTSVLLHSIVFKEFGLFNCNLVHLCDMEFWIRVASNAGLVYVPESLVTFRVHSTSTSAVNRDQRFFRSEILDPLLLLHEYAYNPAFARVRKSAKAANPPCSLENSVAQKAFWAYSTARYSVKRDAARQELLDEWQEVLRKFPRVRNLHFRWLAVKDFLKRHLLWRFAAPASGASNK